MFNLWLDYPSPSEELQIVKTTTSPFTPLLQHVLSGDQIIAYQDLVRRVPVADNVIAFAVRLATMTRPKTGEAPKFIRDWLTWGAGPRASQYLILGAKTRAILTGRHTPDIDDVRRVAVPVMRHRIVPNFNAEADGVTALEIVERLLVEAP
jgi:MoxR-like ATPase